MNFNAIKYGWVALAGVTIVGTTIYVANNQRHQVQQVDVIEIVLGAYERCLATVYPEDIGLPETNRRYGVAPFNIVRDWKTTNGIERVTNAIGWQVDRDMMITVDNVIKALIPCFADTNFACTSLNTTVRLTVTGVWDLLKIGDGINRFTRTPELPDTTNYVVSYTNYWPSCFTSEIVSEIVLGDLGGPPPSRMYSESWSVEPRGHDNHVWVTREDWPYEIIVTNGYQYRRYYIDYTNFAGSTSSYNIVRYTTTVDEAVSYAEYWEFPSGIFSWVTRSNWPTIISSNPAIYSNDRWQKGRYREYSGYPWQIYEQDLVERYKVLNHLRVLAYPVAPGAITPSQKWSSVQKGSDSHFLASVGYPPNVSRETFDNWRSQAHQAPSDTFGTINPPHRRAYVVGYSLRTVWGDGEYQHDTIESWLMLGRWSARGRYEVTGLPTNGRPYNLVIETRDITHYPDDYLLFGTNWTTIYAATNSLEPEHFTEYYGTHSLYDIPIPADERFPLTWWNEYPPWTTHKTFAAIDGSTETRLTCLVGEVPVDASGREQWSSNVYANFSYATNAFWE